MHASAQRAQGLVRAKNVHIFYRSTPLWRDPPLHHKQTSTLDTRLRVLAQVKSSAQPNQEYLSSAFRFQAVATAPLFFARRLLANVRALKRSNLHRSRVKAPRQKQT